MFVFDRHRVIVVSMFVFDRHRVIVVGMFVFDSTNSMIIAVIMDFFDVSNDRSVADGVVGLARDAIGIRSTGG